jgi:hypothetical protein
MCACRHADLIFMSCDIPVRSLALRRWARCTRREV